MYLDFERSIVLSFCSNGTTPRAWSSADLIGAVKLPLVGTYYSYSSKTKVALIDYFPFT